MAAALSMFLTCLGNLFTVKGFLYILAGVVWGIIGGAIPGISASIAMSLMLPLTYGMDPMFALPMLASVYVGAEYGGSIPGILIQAPGTGAAAASMIDGYEMQKKGEGGKALFTSLYAGVIGGLVSVVILVFAAIPLANFAIKFGPAQYFWLAVLGLSMVGTIAADSPTKGLISGLFGMWLSTIGLDMFTGVKRFTFGIIHFMEGLDMIPVLVGVFAMGEIYRQIFTNEVYTVKPGKFKMTFPNKKEMKQITPIVLIAGAWGSIVGALPGAGANIASWSALAQAKNLCRNTETFGHGDIRGVAAPEAANNGVPAGALIPLLGLGVPGSNSTAILMAGFTIAGIACGPLLFKTRPEVPYTMMASMFVAQIVLALIGLAIITPIAKLTSCRKCYLTAAIIMFGLLGAFATVNQTYACWLVFGFRFLGLAMKWFKFTPAATALGFVLGQLTESNMRRALQLSAGNGYGIFCSGVINKVLIIGLIASIAMPIISKQRGKALRRREAAEKAKTEQENK